MKYYYGLFSFCLLFFIFSISQQGFSQPFSLANIPQHSGAFSVSSNCNITITSAGGGTQQWQGSSVGTNGLGGSGGGVAQNCTNQTGLRLEMSGAGNSAGTAAWNNSITVTITFPQGVKGPVTFGVFDLTEPWYNDGSSNYAYYQDKVTISATKCDGAAITPLLTANNGPITSSTVGTSLVLTALQLQGACTNEPVSVGTASDLIKTLTIVYSNQDPPNNIPAPVGSPPRYGISQYQYVFISNINASPPDPIIVSATPNPVCPGQSTTLTASSSTAYTYSWASGTTPTTGSPVTATPMATTTYTVSGAIGSCIQTNTVTVTVSSGITPVFNSMGPYCVSAIPGALPTTSNNGITGTWNPAAISTIAAGTTVYTFTPNGGQCASNTTMSVTVNANLSPTFNTFGPYCIGAIPGTLPTTSNNGITGTWNPATISTATAGNTVYTFTPAVGQCGTITTRIITVTANITPTFTALGPYCIGATPGTLASTSTNGIAGTWNPATISTAAAGTTVYTFTPNGGQCASNTTMSVTITTNITPTFTTLGPYCVGATPGNLPTTSVNVITGTWNPATISTAATGTTVYTFTPNGGQCASNTTMSVTITANITPTFTTLGPLCVSAIPGILPTTSNNGITGTWNPATISTAAAGTTVYTFTPNGGQCASNTTMSITVNANISPTFNTFGPYCIGAIPGTLPTTSNNGITGTWNPATISTAAAGNTVYTFTPAVGQCGTITTRIITVTANITPTFTALGPYCIGATPGTLASTSTNGIAGTWNPATISTAAAGTTVYTFTPNGGQCASNTTMSVTVSTNITPTFTALGPYCVSAIPGTLPTTSNNGISGTWNPAAISTIAAGTTVYTFIPTVGQCGTNTTMSITVNSNISPTFNVFGPYCVGAIPGTLPTTSNNGITGTWNPATISTAAAGTTVYTFTPAVGQCGTITTTSITVNANITPTFTALGPYCVGATPGTLPTTSNNSITGTWNPTVISTTTGGTTVYTFTPTVGQCATTTTMSVTVSANITPTFTTLGPYCVGSTAGTLPTTSVNGFTGTWNPATISTAAAGTIVYTFAPTVGQCATSTTMSVTVSANITPTFTALGPYCVGATAGILPPTSVNGITGTWNPATISTAAAGTTVYTFIPTVGQCATSTTMSVTVNANATPTFTALGPYCVGDTPGTLPTASNNSISGTWNPAIISTAAAGTTVYTFTPGVGQCATTETMSVIINPQLIPNFAPNISLCYGTTAPALSNTSPNGIAGSWDPPVIDNMNSGTYTFTPTSTLCTSTQTITVTVINSLPITVTPQSATICAGGSVSLAASGATTYNWSPASTLSVSTGPQVIATPQVPTTYTVLGYDNMGCTGSATVTVDVSPDVPFSFSLFPARGCEPLLVNFVFDTNNTMIDQATLHYNFDDPQSGNNTSSDAITTHLYNEHGIYVVSLTANNIYGCPVSFYDTVIVYKMPIAQFTYRPEQVEITDPEVHFYDQSYNATAWNWSFGDGYTLNDSTSVLQHPIHIYSDTGNYQVILIVSNGQVCFDTAVQTLHVLPEFMFWLPNSFTPDGNSTNNNFYGQGVGFRTEDFEMYVYDRWGKLMYSKTGYDEIGWDGSYMNKGKRCEQGVYTYLIRLTEASGIRHAYKGIIILLL